jgi:hypothetical protein
MSISFGKDALLRDAGFAGDKAQEEMQRMTDPRLTPDGAAALALASIAHSARELCCLARVALAYLSEKKT